MNLHENSLLATCKTVAAFGVKHTADFPPASVGAQQFALVAAAVPTTDELAASQVSGSGLKKSGVVSKAVAHLLLHDELLGITDAAHSLALLGTTGLEGKFRMPRSAGDQALLNSARAYAADAAPFEAQFISLNIEPDFIAHLNTSITALESALATKTAGQGDEAVATGGLADATHKAAIALRVLGTIVPNKYKKNPAVLAEWATASHIEKHTPVPRAPKPAKPAAAA